MEVRKSITVRRPIEVTFTAFTAEIGRWWPLQMFTYGGSRAKEIHLEGHLGGRFYERFSDGEEYTIGTVTHYDPPNRVTFTWREGESFTTVDVTFTAVPEGTLVELNHSGWQNEQMAANFGQGWAMILQRFGQVAEQ